MLLGSFIGFQEFEQHVKSIADKKTPGIEFVKSKVVQLIESGKGEYMAFIRENAGSLDKFLDIALELKKMGPDGIKKKVSAIAGEHIQKLNQALFHVFPLYPLIFPICVICAYP